MVHWKIQWTSLVSDCVACGGFRPWLLSPYTLTLCTKRSKPLWHVNSNKLSSYQPHAFIHSASPDVTWYSAPYLIFSYEFCFSGVSKMRCYYFHIIKAKPVSLSLKLFISLQLDLNLWLHHHNPRAITTRPHGPRAVFGGGSDVSYFRCC